ncbi:MAG TPA: hypothetical protein VFJ43_14105 [Bacteroidia bacterium]|nr:hypothetical protein [Bacteroidia bacterium]
MRKLFPFLFLFLYSCSEPSSNVNPPVNTDSPSVENNSPTHCGNPKGAPKQKDIAWQIPSATLSKEEEAITGTWTAVTSDQALSTGGVTIMTDPNSGKTGMDQLVDAAEKMKRANTNCIWLEFYDDHTGFWNSCMLMNGSPNAMDNVDLFTGEHKSAGVMFDWYFDNKTIHIQFEDCLKYPMMIKDTTLKVRVRYWDMEIVKAKTVGGTTVYKIRDHFPEYDFKSPVTFEYEMVPKLINGKVGKYQNPIME